MNKIIEDELTYKIIWCAVKVHNTLGNGFQEVIYQRVLAIESGNQQVDFERQCLMKKNPRAIIKSDDS